MWCLKVNTAAPNLKVDIIAKNQESKFCFLEDRNQWLADDQDSLEFSDWLENQLEIAI